MGTQSAARSREGRRRALVVRERKIVTVANRQHGVLSRQQLLNIGLSGRTIRRRVEAGRLHVVHRGIYALGGGRISQRGVWMGAVLASGEGALLSHRSAATLWGLMNHPGEPVEVTAAVAGRGRQGIVVHQGGIAKEDRAAVGPIPVTTVAHTLFDLGEVLDEQRLTGVVEEADRMRLLRLPELEAICARCPGRRALRPIRRLIEEVRAPEETRTPLEDRVLELCRHYELPTPVTNVNVLGHEVDVMWSRERLIVEADSVTFHGHRAAFERDRKRDAARQVEGYRVIRLTHRRITREPAEVADELRRLLNSGREAGRAAT